MLTSRSEHRLRLREGNADLRLISHGYRLGLVSASAFQRTEARRRSIAGEVARLKSAGLVEVLRRPEMTYRRLGGEGPNPPLLPERLGAGGGVQGKDEGRIPHLDLSARGHHQRFSS